MSEQLKMQTKDLAEENAKKLMELFPNAVTETIDINGNVVRAIDKDILQQEINAAVVEGREERYQFTWPDKKKAIVEANKPITKTLRPCREESVDFDNTENLYIEGDNLEVLKLLQETYLGKVKMIYIDPPYNTGHDMVYQDDFRKDNPKYKAESGDYDEEGNQLFENTTSNGRFHTDWLNMMYPRLKLAKNLLTDDGVIFISIDENENKNLRKLCDEVFGEQNFVAEIVWAAGRKNDSKHISISHEYIICYFRNSEYIKEKKIIWRERKQGLDDIYKCYGRLKEKYGDDYKTIEKELKTWFKELADDNPAKAHIHYNRVDRKGIYFADNISWPGGGGPKYEVLHPITNKPVKIPSRGWITNKDTLLKWAANDLIDFGLDENCVPTIKSYLTDRELSVPYSVFYKDGRASSKRLAEMLGRKIFENPKDDEIIKRLIQFSVNDFDAIILDFFSGSATTAHAVMQLNAEDGGHRKFIMVQLPEPCDEESEAFKAGYKNICEIGKERIRRAGKKIVEGLNSASQSGEGDRKAVEGLDIGFRVLKVDESNMKEGFYLTPNKLAQENIQLFEENVKDDRTAEDLLFQAMLEIGLLPSNKIEVLNVQGKQVFRVTSNEGTEGYCLACFDEGLNEEIITEIAKMNPCYFVTQDRSIASDSLLSNFEQIFRTYDALYDKNRTIRMIGMR